MIDKFKLIFVTIIIILFVSFNLYQIGFEKGIKEGENNIYNKIVSKKGESCLVNIYSEEYGQRSLYDEWCIKELNKGLDFLLNKEDLKNE